MRNSFFSAVVVSIAFFSSAVAHAQTVSLGNIEIEHPYTWASPPGARVGGAFMVLHNKGKEADKLVRASTPVAGVTEIHDHIKENGVMKMRAVPHIVIEPGKSVALKPGSFHLMFFELKRAAKAGEKFPVTLEFEKAGKTTVQVEVESRTGGHDHSKHKH
jgi:periplasmic copper chaperone A